MCASAAVSAPLVSISSSARGAPSARVSAHDVPPSGESPIAP